MFKEFLIFSIHLIAFSLVTSLVLAYPAARLGRGFFGRTVKFLRAYLLVLAVDVLGHWAVLLFSFPFGRYRPPLVMEAAYLAENLAYLMAVGLITAWLALGRGRPLARFIAPGLGWSLAVGIVIIAKDLLIMAVISAWFMPAH